MKSVLIEDAYSESFYVTNGISENEKDILPRKFNVIIDGLTEKHYEVEAMAPGRFDIFGESIKIKKGDLINFSYPKASEKELKKYVKDCGMFRNFMF